MNRISKEELTTTLVDVRKAYRLLYLYQRRVMDTVKYISDVIGVNIEAGFALFSEGSPKSYEKYRNDRLAWDWMNMYMYEFFCGKQHVDGHEISFAIAVQSDTGYFDAPAGTRNTAVTSFAPPEDARTRILFFIGKNTWKAEKIGDNTGEFYQRHHREFIEKTDKGIFLAKAFELEEMIDEQSIARCLQELEQFCHANDVPQFALSRVM